MTFLTAHFPKATHKRLLSTRALRLAYHRLNVGFGTTLDSIIVRGAPEGGAGGGSP